VKHDADDAVSFSVTRKIENNLPACKSRNDIKDNKIEKDASHCATKPIPSTSYFQMRVKLMKIVVISQRFGISNRTTAAIVSSVMQDLGIVTELDTLLVTKIRLLGKK